MKNKVTVRISKIFVVFLVIFFLLILFKLCYVSLMNNVEGVNLKEFSNNRNTKEDTIYAKRGNIYDLEGNVLASVVNSYKIIAYLDENRTNDKNNPNHVVDKEATAKMLQEELGIDYKYALEQLNKDKYQVEFGVKGKNITESIKNKISSLNMPGISFLANQKRTYSMGSFASYIIGYAKKNIEDEDSDINGEMGIEQYYNDDLKGSNGSLTYEVDAYGYTLPSAEVIEEKAVDGSDIYLTIDSNIQLFAENLTSNISENYQLDWMIFSVMDAKTGAIVASSTYPNFDPNDLNSIESYMNPLVSYEYEPGSTMKIFSFASAIEEGIYDGSATYKSGQKAVADVTINDFNEGQGWGTITYDTGFIYSSNVAATNLGLKLGADKLMDYYKKLGFGSLTGIELANEVDGKISFKYDSEIATASFGQGITVTPIQILQALSAVTNDGTTLKPYVVSKIVDGEGKTTYEGGRVELNKVYSKETIDYMKKLMHSVVYDGLSKYWQPTKTSIIGKTGTAQIASSKGGYLSGENNYIRSFAGIFPEDDPKYIVYVAVKCLHGKASVIAGELTKSVDDIISYLGLENNDTKLVSKIIKLDNYLSSITTEVVSKLEEENLKPIVLGTGKYIINQYPLNNSKVFNGSKVFLITNNNDYKMIDLKDFTMNETLTYLNLLKINYTYSGSGKVVSQSINPGESLENISNIDIIFG